jgi:hypothetical protein
MHGKGTASVIASTKFLIAYVDSLQVGSQERWSMMIKVKQRFGTT